MMKLITADVWTHITRAAKACPSQAWVAVAYFGAGASKLLPLKKGSTLVVDMSHSAVASGQTCPAEILKLLEVGVDVYTVSNLHAKVFVFGNRALIGSANASWNSSRVLVEAVVATENRHLVAAARRFVRGQRFQMVTPEYARSMAKLYKPPKFGGGGGSRKTHGRPNVPVVHVLHLKHVRLSREERSFDREQTALAKKQRKKPRSSRVESIKWEGRCRLQPGDVVVQITEERDRRKMVSPAGNVLRVRRFGEQREAIRFVYFEIPKRLRRLNLKTIVRRLGPAARGHLAKDRAIRNVAFARSLLSLWHSSVP